MRGRTRAVLLACLLVLTGCSATPAPAVPVTPPPVTVTPAPPEQRVPAPEPEVAVDPLPAGPVNVLLIGTDSRDPADLTGNADTITLAQVSADRGSVHLVSLTRDMWVAIPGLGEGKINAAFARGGTDLLMATVSDLLGGVEIHYAVQSNFAGFIALTRALGGFEVDNQHATTVTVLSTGRVVEFPQGRIRLENTDGLIYVRERRGLPLGDLDRTERQRAALVGMAEAVREHAQDPVALLDLVAMLHRNVKITGDLSVEDALALVPLVQGLGRDDVVGLMVPITGFGTRSGQSVNLVDEVRTAELGEALREGRVEDYVAAHGTGYAP